MTERIKQGRRKVKDQDRFDHRAMMSNPNLWYRWPYLPLKKRRTDGRMPDIALLKTTTQGMMIAVGANMFENTEDKDWKLTTIDQVILQGWEVD